MADQEKLVEIPEQPAVSKPEPAPGKPKLMTANRDQQMMAIVTVEELIPADHVARAIWELTGTVNLDGYRQQISSYEGEGGRPAWDPRLLVSVWVYGYSEGIRSARELERLMEYEPGLQWLMGTEVINHHTLSDFRVSNKELLDDLMAQLLALLEQAGMVDLKRVMHDGTKIQAQASSRSFQSRKGLESSLERARQVMTEAGDPNQPEESRGRQAARERARREWQQRLEEAQSELKRLQACKAATEAEQVRVSVTEPESRRMKQPDGGYCASYNVQISTDAKEKIIVGVGASQSSADHHELKPALERIEKNFGRLPEEMVVDGGYESRETIVEMAEANIDLVMPVHSYEQRASAALKGQGGSAEFGPQAFEWDANSDTMRCPAGESLVRIGQQTRRDGQRLHYYRAINSQCQGCRYEGQCCPKNAAKGRMVARVVHEVPVIAEFHKKMAGAEAKQIYRQRGEVAEFPNAWLKEKIGLRRFLLRGKLKAEMEVTWACLSYNVRQWFRLLWRPRQRMAIAS